MQYLINLFLERTSVAMKDWAEANREVIGNRQLKHILKEICNFDGRTVPAIMGFALWCFNTVANYGVMAGLGPSKVNLVHIPDQIDRESTMRLLHLCAACMTLQYFPK